MKLTDEQRDWLNLSLVPGVGTTYFIRLLARFRTPGAVLQASLGALREVAGPKLAERISQYAQVVDLEGQERLMDEYHADLVTLDDPRYPLRLGEIYDPPLVLFTRGEFQEEDETAVAIVGTRRPTPYGIRMAEKLGRELAARGVTVVSGMATGIDSAAHRGAIEAGGRTVAVLGSGVDIVYPAQNADLMHEIIRHGAVVSQFAMGVKVLKGHFPYRNRIISGMTLGTVVVQAPLKSGALITARQAMEQGREVFAVPGEIGVHCSEGPHSLLKEGAKLVESVEDILLELKLPAEIRSQPTVVPSAGREVPVPATGAAPPSSPNTTEAESVVLSVLSPNGSFVDEIAQASRLSVSETLSSLTLLELKGLVRQFSGKRFAPR